MTDETAKWTDKHREAARAMLADDSEAQVNFKAAHEILLHIEVRDEPQAVVLREIAESK